MSRAWRRLASAVFQLDVALLLGCAAIELAMLLLSTPLTQREMVEVPIQGILELVPLLLLVRFARRRSDAGRPLSLGLLAVAIAIAAMLGAVVTTYPGPWDIRTVALEGYGGLVRAVLFVAALELHARALRAQTLAHEMRQTTARLDAEVQEARARLLEAQIEPHFLFNTLANVRQLQRTEPRTALRMLDDLIEYLERSLPGLQRERTTLDEERALVAAYLRLHRPRFGARLEYDIAFPDRLLGCELPSMMLLTLVENSLKHGLGPLPEGGAIRVSAASSGEALLVDVVDTGAGMGAGTGGGTGLANVRSRLALRYGGAARLTLSLNEPRGVRASLRIPLAAAELP
jgi:signal transduction histidine kinase